MSVLVEVAEKVISSEIYVREEGLKHRISAEKHCMYRISMKNRFVHYKCRYASVSERKSDTTSANINLLPK